MPALQGRSMHSSDQDRMIALLCLSAREINGPTTTYNGLSKSSHVYSRGMMRVQ
jgi:hypothetical protein